MTSLSIHTTDAARLVLSKSRRTSKWPRRSCPSPNTFKLVHVTKHCIRNSSLMTCGSSETLSICSALTQFLGKSTGNEAHFPLFVKLVDSGYDKRSMKTSVLKQLTRVCSSNNLLQNVVVVQNLSNLSDQPQRLGPFALEQNHSWILINKKCSSHVM
jgi:hypothetical protein